MDEPRLPLRLQLTVVGYCAMIHPIPLWLIATATFVVCVIIALGYRMMASRQRRNHDDLLQRHRQTRQQLEASEAFASGIIDSMPSMLIGVDPELNITRWNNEAESLTSISRAEAIGKPLLTACPSLPFSDEIVREAIDGDHSVTFESTLDLPRSTEKRFVAVVIYPLNNPQQRGAVIRIDNVTERVKLERMLVQDDKLVSLGRMAAGLAHEVNNPLAAMLSSAKTIERRLTAEIAANQSAATDSQLDFAALQKYLAAREIPNLLSDISSSGERAAYIMKSMLDFSYNSDLSHAPIALPELIQQSLAIARQNFPTEIRRQLIVEQDIPDPAPVALGIAVEIGQVLVNVLSNAADALDDFRQRHSDSAFRPRIDIRVRSQKEIVMIDIADNGPGIAPEQQKAIFEPFYTTKSIGKGTGLGLAISYFIMTEHHRGALEVFSDQDGSCFRLSLPRANS